MQGEAAWLRADAAEAEVERLRGEQARSLEVGQRAEAAVRARDAAEVCARVAHLLPIPVAACCSHLGPCVPRNSKSGHQLIQNN